MEDGSSSTLGKSSAGLAREDAWLVCEKVVLQQLSKGLGPARPSLVVLGMGSDCCSFSSHGKGQFLAASDLSRSLQGWCLVSDYSAFVLSLSRRGHKDKS